MVGVLNSRSSGLSPGHGHCVVFLGNTLFSHSTSPPESINGYRRIFGKNEDTSQSSEIPGMN